MTFYGEVLRQVIHTLWRHIPRREGLL